MKPEIFSFVVSIEKTSNKRNEYPKNDVIYLNIQKLET